MRYATAMAFLPSRALPILFRSRITRSPLCVRATLPDDGLRGFALLRADSQRAWNAVRQISTSSVSTPASANLPTSEAFKPVYDAGYISEYYSARPITAVTRLARVAAPFGVWLMRVRYFDKIWANPPTEKRADQLRELLCWAGPTYLKIGQAIGNRPDIVGLVYSSALQTLVDDVGTFDSDLAQAIVCEQLGIENVSEVFSEFGEEAVASASLGQVHKARLRKSGEWVAVKVQRPLLRNTAPLDVYVLRRLADYAKKTFTLRSNLVGIVDEFASRLWEELDYEQEANNMDRFRELYADDNIYIPRVYREYTTERVLTMEWIDGDKPPWMPREDARRLINIGVQCSLRQLLEYGLLHADPHVGNLLRKRDTNQLVYLDFGMCITLPKETRNTLIAAVVRLINRDYGRLAEDFVKLGFLPDGIDTKPIVPLLQKAFGDASDNDSVAGLSFGKLAENLTELAIKTPVRIPVFFTLIIRSLTILEGIALQTDSEFKIVDQSYPFVVQRVLSDDSPVLKQALRNVLISEETGRIRWDRLQSIASGLSSSSSSSSYSKSVSRGALDGVSSAAVERLLDFTLSEKGEFFRTALTLELTDTVDAVQLALAHRAHQLSGGLLPRPLEDFDAERVEKGLQIADAVRRRGPSLLGGAGDSRREIVAERMSEMVRVVLADITDRNTRRILRRLVRFVLGERVKEE